ncbi:hypothetical protein SAY87_013498 [Trapa incisa]|uniref:Pentatricopeptide repeat-containing protein n=1 Tax=Trapa incisa TaxID=236973 RepID=A0AAN7QG53_9MYRT|nr:hypothetical protein SAY87_013498 [Trapa incisa]
MTARTTSKDSNRNITTMKEGMEARCILYLWRALSMNANDGDIEDACKLLREAKQMHKNLSPVMYHTLVRGYCKLKEFHKVLGLLRDEELWD